MPGGAHQTFDAESLLRSLMDDRLSTVGGTLEVDSPAGAGTRLRARVPLES